MKKFYVYILCNKRNGTLYTGVTSDIIKRIYEHKHNLVKGFTQKYNIHHLVWYEIHETAEIAISREKQIKAWKNNPEWKDLYYDIIGESTGFLLEFTPAKTGGRGWNNTIKRKNLPNKMFTNTFMDVQK